MNEDDSIHSSPKSAFEHRLSQLMQEYDELSWQQRARALSWHAELAWSRTDHEPAHDTTNNPGERR